MKNVFSKLGVGIVTAIMVLGACSKKSPPSLNKGQVGGKAPAVNEVPGKRPAPKDGPQNRVNQPVVTSSGNALKGLIREIVVGNAAGDSTMVESFFYFKDASCGSSKADTSRQVDYGQVSAIMNSSPVKIQGQGGEVSWKDIYHIETAIDIVPTLYFGDYNTVASDGYPTQIDYNLVSYKKQGVESGAGVSSNNIEALFGTWDTDCQAGDFGAVVQ